MSSIFTMGQSILVGVAVTSHNTATLNTATFRPPFVHNFAFGLPRGWNDADIGAVGKAGLTSYDAGVFTVRGSGADIWGSTDSFHFLSQTMYGPDAQIVVRVTGVENTNSFAKTDRRYVTASRPTCLLPCRGRSIPLGDQFAPR
jgi:hypothetical protein